MEGSSSEGPDFQTVKM